MIYYITYRLKQDTTLNVTGPYSDIEYMHMAMEIVSGDGVYDLDIVNEPAMEFYFAYLAVEEEYKEAARQLIESPGCEEWTLEDQVAANRLTNSINKELLESALSDPDSPIENTIATLETINTLDLVEDPYDFPF